MPSSALRGAALTRAALVAASLLLAFAFSATAAQAVTPSYGVAQDTATMSPLFPGVTEVFPGGDDDEVTTTTAPFPVSLYGVTDTVLSVSTNGYVGIGAGTVNTNAAGDNVDFDTPVIAAFQSDLYTADGAVLADTRGTAPDRRFVLQWNVAICCDLSATARFQVIFTEGSDEIQTLYEGALGNPGWVGAKLDPNEFVRPDGNVQPYPASGTRLTFSPATHHLTTLVTARAADTTPTFTGTTDDLTEDVGLAVYAGTDLTAPPVLSTTATPAAITGDYTTTVATLDALEDGDYTVVASQPTDGHGKTHETFTVDTTAPAGLTLVGPVARSNASAPTFTGAAGGAAGDQPPTVEIHEGTTTAGATVESIDPTGNASAYSGTSDGLDDGTYTAQAVQADDVGNASDSTPVTFTVDTTSANPFFSQTPARSSATPYLAGFGGTEVGDDATVTVDVYAGPDATGTRVQRFNGVALDGDGRFAVTAAALPEGRYTADVLQGDDVGNPTGTDPYTFLVDATAPTITLTAPADGAQSTDTRPLFSGTATRAVGDDGTVGVALYAGSDTTVEPVGFLEADVAGDGTWSGRPGAALAPGRYTARAYQYDDVGNSDLVDRTLTVLAPAVAAPPAPAPVLTPAPVTIPPPPVTVCKSDRLLRKHLDRPSGTRLRVTSTLNGRAVRSIINGDGITVTVDLRGKGKGTYKLKVAMTRRQATGRHKTITSTRTFTYKVCL